MTRAVSKTPAKTRRFRVVFKGPKGGFHHLAFTFKLNQQILFESSLAGSREREIIKNMKGSGWVLRMVEWFNSERMIHGVYPTNPNAILLYRIHRNDIYNAKDVKPGWKIVGEY